MYEEIIIQNLWWKTKSVSGSKLGRLKRAEFSNLLEELEDDKITCLLGPRGRCGHGAGRIAWNNKGNGVYAASAIITIA